MKLSIGAVFAFAVAVLAKPKLTNSNYEVQEGQPFTLKWSDAQGPVTITLMTGKPDNLKVVTDITTGQTGTEFTFTPEDLPSGTYAFRISDGSGEPNYSPTFTYVGTGTLTTTSASSSTSASRSSTSASVSSTTSSDSSATSSTTSASSTSTSTFTTTTSARTSSTTRPAQSTTPPNNTNNAQRFASPLALVLVTVAALVFFH